MHKKLRTLYITLCVGIDSARTKTSENREDTVLLQQVDFLETILEETSDDLQSDSDRSGTTYWVGSDSETESVIHIRARQRLAAACSGIASLSELDFALSFNVETKLYCPDYIQQDLPSYE
ncbi:hypothetical protein K0M31_011268 [Melipona bicolor]|uniref:Uncharacterized protein n=1 Tax=Melipona bicolor TaxID=60889 RepID=A0AA40KUG6_9HYME|nr:hypothetical protein K0M31_011268 [Melipona bicolor]